MAVGLKMKRETIMADSKKKIKHFEDELSIIRKLIGNRPVIRKTSKGNWVICNRFSGEAIVMGSLPDLISLSHKIV